MWPPHVNAAAQIRHLWPLVHSPKTTRSHLEVRTVGLKVVANLCRHHGLV